MDIMNKIVTSCDGNFLNEICNSLLLTKMLLYALLTLMFIIFIRLGDIVHKLNIVENKLSSSRREINDNIEYSTCCILSKTQLFKTTFNNKINNLKQVFTNEIRKKLNIKKINIDYKYDVANDKSNYSKLKDNELSDENISGNEFENDKTLYDVINNADTNYKFLFENKTKDEFKQMFYDKINELLKVHKNKKIVKCYFKINGDNNAKIKILFKN